MNWKKNIFLCFASAGLPGFCRTQIWRSKLLFLLYLSLLASSLTMLNSCNSPYTSGSLSEAPIVAESKERYSKEYLIVAGDRLEVIVRGHPEISRLASSNNPGILVRPDGYITLPLIDDVKVSRLTFMQLKDKLTVLFSKRLVEPEVTVIGTSLREPMVYVLGEVPNPRPIPLREASTAFQAIAYAGGLKHTGVSNAVALIRLDDQGHLHAYKIAVNLEGQPAPYMALQATILHSDDIILVPESDITQFGRWINEYINQPLQGVNSVLAPVANFLLIKELIDDDSSF